MLYLGRWVAVGQYKDGGVLGAGSCQRIVSDKKTWDKLLPLLALISKKGFSNVEELKSQNPELAGIIDYMNENHFFTENETFDSEGRYSRNELYYGYNGVDSSKVQQKLNSSEVTVIGCGGIGTNIAYYMATSGVGNITLVDSDIIELSNLTRQVLFTEEDIGALKTQTLKRELLRRNHTTKIEIIEKSIDSYEDVYSLPKSDLYIVSADTPSQLIEWINKACVDKQQAYINIGYINDISVVGIFYIPGETACIKCNSILPGSECDKGQSNFIETINRNSKSASFPAVNGVAAPSAFADIIKYLGDFGEILSKNKRIGIHSKTSEIEFQYLAKNKSCSVCGTKQI